MLYWVLQIIVGSEPLRDLISMGHEIMKNLVVAGIEPLTSGLLDPRRSRSDNQALYYYRYLLWFRIVTNKGRCNIVSRAFDVDHFFIYKYLNVVEGMKFTYQWNM